MRAFSKCDRLGQWCMEHRSKMPKGSAVCEERADDIKREARDAASARQQ